MSEDAALTLEDILLSTLPCLVNKHKSKTPSKFSKEEIDEVFYYDESSETCLRWLRFNGSKNPASVRNNGDVAGYFNTNDHHAEKRKKYFTVRFNKKVALVHRIIWNMHYGEIPQGMVINHRDGDALNNKIINLECITQAQNSRRTVTQDYLDSGVKEMCANNKYYYAKSTWNTLEGERVCLLFPYSKYGKDKAIEMARNARKEALIALNALGAGYNLID